MENSDHIIDGLIENVDYTRGGDLEERHKAFKNEMRVMNVALVDRYYIDYLKAEYEEGKTEGGPFFFALLLCSISGAIMGSVIVWLAWRALGG